MQNSYDFFNTEGSMEYSSSSIFLGELELLFLERAGTSLLGGLDKLWESFWLVLSWNVLVQGVLFHGLGFLPAP